MNNAKSFLPPSLIFAVGSVIGLGLGLWIGWGLWPVEWQGGTVNDLNQASKAEYIAAVADAFVIYDTPEAAALARQRLAPLAGDLDSEFVSAIRYFQNSSQTERAIRVSNIGRLASALGMVPPDLQGSTANSQNNVGAQNGESTQGNAVGETASASVATPAGETSPASSTSTISWFRWLLWLLAAILLVSGGFYLMGAAGILDMQQLLERLRNLVGGGSEIDEFTPDNYPQQPISNRRQRPHEQPVTFVPESEDLAFDREEDVYEDWPQERTTRTAQPYDWQSNTHEPWTAYQHADFDDLDNTSDAEESGFDNADQDFDQEDEDYDRFHPQADPQNPVHFTSDTFQEISSPTAPPSSNRYTFDSSDEEKVPTVNELIGRAPRTSPSTSNHATEDDNFRAHVEEHRADDEIDEMADDWDDEEDYAEDSSEKPQENNGVERHNQRISFPREELNPSQHDSFQHRAPQPSHRESRPITPATPLRDEKRTPQNIPPARRPKHQLIDQHTLTYQMGMAEYDESKPIVDPDSNKYVGEFGMGTSGKNSVIQPNGGYVAALEVWLFDKSDEKNMGNQTRILLSEYAVDHNLEAAFVKERNDNPRPFTPQAGVHFQIESQNLLLDCTIVDVKYLESGAGKGMFGSIRVDMSVHKKS